MTESEVQNLVVQRFDSMWFDTSIEHSNTRIDKDSLNEWVRLSIQFSPARRIGFGKTALRRGTIYVQTFTKIGIGQGRSIELAEKAAAIFGSWTVPGLDLSPHDLTILGEKATMGLTTTETNWFQVNCAIDFSFVD